jgi:hypothetical protein
VIGCLYHSVFFSMCTFKSAVFLSCCLALLFKPRGQVFCPSVRILLDFHWDCFNDPRFFGFCYYIFFYFPCSQCIVVAILSCNFIKLRCKTASIAILLPLANAIHIYFRIITPYPLISLILHCRGIQLTTIWGWI